MAKKKTARKSKARPKTSSRKKAIQKQWNEFLEVVKPDAIRAGMTALEFVEKLVADNLRTAFGMNKTGVERPAGNKSTSGKRRSKAR